MFSVRKNVRLSFRSYEEATADVRARAAAAVAEAKLPTRDTYERMTDEQLQTLITTKDRQIGELRNVYENFHYEIDKRYRKMIFDYHDKALTLSKVHGDMQMSSLTINREALQKMRERDEARNRDRRLVQTICLFVTLVYWVWLRRHYIDAKEAEDPTLARSVGTMGWAENPFSSAKRNARSWDTPYEREIRAARDQETAAASASGGTAAN